MSEQMFKNIMDNTFTVAIVAIFAYSYGPVLAPLTPDWLYKVLIMDVTRVIFFTFLIMMVSKTVVKSSDDSDLVPVGLFPAFIISLVFVLVTKYLYVGNSNSQTLTSGLYRRIHNNNDAKFIW